jgi:hypothetical protein
MKKFYILLIVLFSFTINCDDKNNNEDKKSSECQKIIEKVEDCMNLHRGAFSYINSCGKVEINEVNRLNSCDQLLEYILGK